jgi:hypothetical protein
MAKKNTIEKYIKLARRLGARDAKEISAETIVTAPWRMASRSPAFLFLTSPSGQAAELCTV